MAVIPMSYSPATMAREYRKIGETTVNGRAVDIYIHNDRHHAVAVYGEPDDINGDLRHVIVAKIDLKSRQSEDETETILAVIGYYELETTPLQVEGVIVTKRERNVNVASALYKALINDGIVLVSDNVQFPGGKALWARMARKEVGIDVFVFDSERRAFWPYDGERVKYDGRSIPEEQIWSLAPNESRKGIVLVAEKRGEEQT
ncbi:hypothetical protein LZP96_15705 [Enterobacteriaceae bacterium 155047]|uniref:hypothetical protein n=1 Tax=Huaxiibacter chinensis TaxID=2899785 RepID=UPI0007DA49F3|nr:hypothetical protein [Huaxiibacter chinensis]ANG90911.1 hypothetical protein A8A57_00295 [Lelliottia amnigena]MCG5045467.1 hypothetical protein [Huaxiibacter chinensis]